ncbi:MAG: SAM-dependent methyltransferase, partial [Acetobacter sp.]|nr:SAM-dependent methyltransferase [Acetobacter sp.]
MTVPIVFDYHAVRQHRTRSVLLQNTLTSLLEATADILLDRLDDVSRRFTSALDIGGRGFIAKALLQRDI